MHSPKRVLVFCAHSDDQAIGAGGYIAKLSKQGAEVKTIVCSFGEQSHPHLERTHIRKTRVLESKKADRILGGSGVQFLGLPEGKFEEDCKRRVLHPKLVRNVKEFAPDLILTHSNDDPHPDHRAVHRIIMRVYDGARLSCPVYSFNVWNPFTIRNRGAPKLAVDITGTFRRKLDAIEAFKSQTVAVVVLLTPVYFRAVFWGRRRGCRYAEAYYRVR